jgi:integrase
MKKSQLEKSPAQRRKRGSGTLVEDPKRGWYASVSLREGSKRIRHSTKYFSTASEAQVALDALKHAGSVRARTRETVGGIVQSYINRRDGKPRAETTLQRYRGLAKNLGTITDLQAERLTAIQIENLYSLLREEGLAEGTVFHVHTLLRSSCKWATRKRLISVDPFQVNDIEGPSRARSQAIALTVADAEAFLKHLKHTRYANALLFSLATGMRRGEVCGLRKGSLDLDRAIALVRESRYEVVGKQAQKTTKTGHVREVDLSDVAIGALTAEAARQAELRAKAGDAWADSRFVFTDDLGSPLAPYSLSNAFRHVADKAKLDRRYSLHSLRHTAATWMIASGMEIHAVQRVLGHTEASTTVNIYGHVMEGRTRKAVEAIADRLRDSLPA